MTRRYLAAALLLAACAAAVPARAQVTGRGTEFWACWPRSHLSLETSAELVVMSDSPTTAEVDGAFLAGPAPVAPGAPWIVAVPTSLRIGAERTVVPSGFRVRSLDPARPIVVTLRVPRQAEASDDTARLLPLTELGTRHVVTSYPASLPGEPSLYAVVATADATTVDAGVPCTSGTDRVTLDRGDVYQVFCDWRDAPNDVTGAEIVSDKPVAVFAGNADAFVPVNYLSGDFILEQVPPVASWGTQFLVPPLPKGPGAVPAAHDVVRVMPSAAGTLMVDDGSGWVPYIVAARVAVELQQLGPLHLITDVPVDVYQFATGVEMTDLGDPFMAEIPALSHWGTGARAFIPPYYSSGSWLTLVTASADTGSVRLDGAAVTGWTPFPNVAYSWVLADPGTPGEHVVSGDSPVMVLAHGYNDAYLPDPGLGRTPGSHGTPAAHAVPPCIVVPIMDAPSTSCVGARITLREAGSTASGCDRLEYRWLENGVEIPGCGFGEGTDCETPFRGDATYTLEVRCATETTCVASASRRVVDQPPPAATIVPNPATICEGVALPLEGPPGFVLYAWSSTPVDPGVTPSASALPGITATPDVDTRYTLTAFDVRGCATVANVMVTVTPDPLPPPIDASLRVAKAASDTILTWTDLATLWRGYQAVFLECSTRDWRRTCPARPPDPVNIQAAPLAGPEVAPGVQRLVHAGALDLGDLIFYKVRATSLCNGRPGPTCNGWPMQIPPCP